MPIIFPAPSNMPVMGSAVSRFVGRILLRATGWKLTGELPNEPKLMIALAPHTSNWDFVLALSVILGVGIRVSWLAKHSMFIWPFKGLLTRIGGIPVNRNLPEGIVEQAVESFRTHSKQIVAIMPEGTRSKVSRWKTGFLRIAYKAEVPVMTVSLDFPRKLIKIGPLVKLTGAEDVDLETVKSIIGRSRGKLVDKQ